MKRRKQRGGMSAAEFWAGFSSPPRLRPQPREVAAALSGAVATEVRAVAPTPIDFDALAARCIYPWCEACPLDATEVVRGSKLCARCAREAKRAQRQQRQQREEES